MAIFLHVVVELLTVYYCDDEIGAVIDRSLLLLDGMHRALAQKVKSTLTHSINAVSDTYISIKVLLILLLVCLYVLICCREIYPRFLWSSQDVFERHRVVLTIAASLASAGAAWTGMQMAFPCFWSVCQTSGRRDFFWCKMTSSHLEKLKQKCLNQPTVEMAHISSIGAQMDRLYM